MNNDPLRLYRHLIVINKIDQVGKAVAVVNGFSLKLLIAVVCCFATAASAQAVDLLKIFRDAQDNDAKLMAARAAYFAGVERLPEARAALLPRLSMNARLFHGNSENGSFPSEAYRSRGYTLSLTQPLFKWDDWQGYKQGRLQMSAAAVAFDQARQDLIVRLVKAYLDTLASQDNVELANEHRRAIAEQLASATQNLDAGNGTIVDVNDAQANLDMAESEIVDAQNELAAKRVALQKIVGRPVGYLARVRESDTIPPPEPADVDQWAVQARSNSYEVQLKEIASQIARIENSKAIAGYLPSVQLVASHSHGDASYVNGQVNFLAGPGQTTDNEVGIQVVIPLFDGLETVSRRRETAMLELQATSELEDARREADEAARRAYLGLSGGLVKVRSLQSARNSAMVARDSNRLGYRVGTKVSVDVLNSENKLYTAERDLAKARYDALLSSVQLKASIASLGEADVAQLNSLLTVYDR